jgi:glycyl-tRNA synthetase
MSNDLMEKVVSLAKRRGFVFPGSEIYGGLANTWDYGPYGVELKNNVKKVWWKRFVHDRSDMVGLDSAILMNPKVWEASGHVQSFSDPLMDCRSCKERVRGDKLIEEHLGIEAAAGKSLKEISEIIGEKKLSCPKCGKSDFTEARSFNLMFKTHQGVIEESSSLVYLRPETAQGIFVNFRNVLNTTRKKLPCGIAQIGKAFRNEITPGNFTYRTREFEQMEIEYFIKPGTVNDFINDWKETSLNFFRELGIKSDKLRFRQHEEKELAHYSQVTFDIEYLFPFGWGELEGISHRGNYDLSRHTEFSGADLTYFDPETNEKYLPEVIEPSFGVDRSVLTFMLDAYDEDEIEGEKRVVMRFHPLLAPIKVTVLPLVKNKEIITAKAQEVFDMLKKHYAAEYDEAGSIGKRYRRQDEIGTPYCVTIDFDTIEKDDSVTIRDRDTTKQERVKIADLLEILSKKMSHFEAKS